MLPMWQLKVKKTIEGQMLNNQISDIMSCPLYKSYTLDLFSLILAQMFASTRVCAEHMLSFCRLKVKITHEGQNWLKIIL